MSEIQNKQGSVKLSEIATDNAQAILNTQVHEDALTVIEQLRNIATDSLRRLGIIAISYVDADETSGNLRWSGEKIEFIAGTNIIIKLLQNVRDNEQSQIINLKLTYGESNTPTTFKEIALANHEICYIELSRQHISSEINQTLTVLNKCGGGATDDGPSAKVSSALPVLKTPDNDIDSCGTICIPLAMRVGHSLWWIFNNTQWEIGTMGALGRVTVDVEAEKPGLQPAAGFSELFFDTFTVGPEHPRTTLNNEYTTATHDAARKLFKIRCTKEYSITTSGTAFTVTTPLPDWINRHCIIYVIALENIEINAAWRRIDSINEDRLSGTLDAPFSQDISDPTNCMISQAVWTKDLTNIGDSIQKTRLRDSYNGADINIIHVDYDDSLIENDEVPDSTLEARIVASASNDGNYSAADVPTSDKFAPIFIRPKHPEIIPDYALLDGATKKRCFVVFFCNPKNGNVTSQANLLRYEISLIPAETFNNGGYLNSAYALSDGSGTPQNSEPPIVQNGKTQWTLKFTFIPGLNPTTTQGDIEVQVDGISIPRYLEGVTPNLPSQLTYTEESDNTIRFSQDLSTPVRQLRVLKRQGVIESEPIYELLAPAVRYQNYIINGAFDYWQRYGPIPTQYDEETDEPSEVKAAASRYLADRWRCGGDYPSGVSLKLTRQLVHRSNPAHQNLPNSIIYYCQCEGTTVANHRQYISQIIEPELIAGKTMTLSFYAAYTPNTSWPSGIPITLEMYQILDGYYLHRTLIDSTTVNITSSTFTRYSKIFTFPSLPDPSVYNWKNVCFEIVFVFPLRNFSYQYEVQFTGIMLNEGTIAVPFTRAGITLEHELKLCMRYCEKSWDTDMDLPNKGGNDIALAATSVVIERERDIPNIYWAKSIKNTTFQVIKCRQPNCRIYGYDERPKCNRFAHISRATVDENWKVVLVPIATETSRQLIRGTLKGIPSWLRAKEGKSFGQKHYLWLFHWLASCEYFDEWSYGGGHQL